MSKRSTHGPGAGSLRELYDFEAAVDEFDRLDEFDRQLEETGRPTGAVDDGAGWDMYRNVEPWKPYAATFVADDEIGRPSDRRRMR